MKFKIEYKLGKQAEELKKMLEVSDREFYPPLSSRKTTAQVVFNGGAETEGSSVDAYFNTLKKQKFVIALDEGHLVGFLSYVINPPICEAMDLPLPSCYVSTVIVENSHRRLGIATKMFECLMKKHRNLNIVTRTWENRNNEEKPRIYTILLAGKLRFSEINRKENERGDNIDTVYYCRKRVSNKDKVRAYKLENKINVVFILTLITLVASILFYADPKIQGNDVVAEIVKAIFTSLFVSILVMSAEIYVGFKDAERESFLFDISEFGISDLNRDKRIELDRLLAECREEIWISGYRLTMTNNLRNEFASAVGRGAKGKALLCGPWTASYEKVFGKPEPEIIDNYIKVCAAIHTSMGPKSEFKIRFVDKPLFNDTYKVDEYLVSGPFLHNRDMKTGKPMHAKDFFSYTIKNKDSKLYRLVENEFTTLFEKTEEKKELDWDRFEKAFFSEDGYDLDQYKLRDTSVEEKTRLFQTCLIDAD